MGWWSASSRATDRWSSLRPCDYFGCSPREGIPGEGDHDSGRMDRRPLPSPPIPAWLPRRSPVSCFPTAHDAFLHDPSSGAPNGKRGPQPINTPRCRPFCIWKETGVRRGLAPPIPEDFGGVGYLSTGCCSDDVQSRDLKLQLRRPHWQLAAISHRRSVTATRLRLAWWWTKQRHPAPCLPPAPQSAETRA
jgi:hypothetical protein